MAMLLFQLGIVFTVGLLTEPIIGAEAIGVLKSSTVPPGPRLEFITQPPRFAWVSPKETVVLHCFGHVKDERKIERTTPRTLEYADGDDEDEDDDIDEENEDEESSVEPEAIGNKSKLYALNVDDPKLVSNYDSLTNDPDNAKEHARFRREMSYRLKDEEKFKENNLHNKLNIDHKPSKLLLTYSWYANGILIEPDSNSEILNNGTLIINYTEQSKVTFGEYRCVVSSRDAGAIVSTACNVDLAVISSTFTEYPQNSTIQFGRLIFLKCKITSVPPAEIIWQKDGKLLSENHRYIYMTSGALLVTNSTHGDSGLYRCAATNTYLNTTVYSEAAIVRIFSHVQPTIDQSSLSPAQPRMYLEVLQDDNLTLPCSSVYPIGSWNFTSRNRKINHFDYLKFLALTKIKPDNSGLYTCKTYRNNDAITQEYYIEVLQEPKFIEKPYNQYYPLARTVRFNCSAKGSPMPTISWYKDGMPIKSNNRIYFKSNTLVISAAVTTDAGIYQCIANNSAGEISSMAALTNNSTQFVHPPRNITCQPLNSTSILVRWSKIEEINLTAYTVHASPRELSERTNKGLYLISYGETHHIIDNLNIFTVYDIYVTSYSKKSASDQSDHVFCSPQGVMTKITSISNNSITVLWQVPKGVLQNVTYTIQWRQVNFPHDIQEVLISDGPLLEYRITNLTNSELYEVRVLGSYKTKPLLQNLDSISWTKSSNFSSAPPVWRESIQLTKNSLNISWNYNGENKLFYVCYKENHFEKIKIEKSKLKITEYNCINSSETWVVIKSLIPSRTYKFQVQAIKSSGILEEPSRILLMSTMENDPIRNLEAKWITNTTILVSWKPPLILNGELLYYDIETCSGPNLQSCTSNIVNPKIQMIELPGFNNAYKVKVHVTSESNDGIKTQVDIEVPSMEIKVPVEIPSKRAEPILGIAAGVVISILFIFLCMWTILKGGQCKSRSPQVREQQYSAPANLRNGYGSQRAPGVSCIHNRITDPMETTELHEIQCLVSPTPVTAQRPNAAILLKEIPEYTNGILVTTNGCISKLPIENHCEENHKYVHITENPQFDSDALNSSIQPLLEGNINKMEVYNGPKPNHQNTHRKSYEDSDIESEPQDIVTCSGSLSIESASKMSSNDGSSIYNSIENISIIDNCNLTESTEKIEPNEEFSLNKISSKPDNLSNKSLDNISDSAFLDNGNINDCNDQNINEKNNGQINSTIFDQSKCSAMEPKTNSFFNKLDGLLVSKSNRHISPALDPNG